MQPKRDPADRRFWPARLGGTGDGFTARRDGKGKQASPDYYGATSYGGSLSTCPSKLRTTDKTVAEAVRTVDAEAVKARARLLAIKAMDRLEDSADSMDVSSLVDTLNAAGKLTGAQVTGSNGVTLNLGLLSGEERAHRAAELMQRAQSRLLASGVSYSSADDAPADAITIQDNGIACLLYTSPSPRDA